MTLYFIEQANQDGSDVLNWFDDAAGTTPAAAIPTTGDDAFIQTGTCDSTTSFGAVTNSVTVVSGANLTDNASGTVTTNNNGNITTNSGAVTTNTSGGVVSNNLYGGVITNQNGTLRIGTVTGGTGSIAAAAATNLASQTAGTNVTFPSGNTSWW